MLKFLTFDISVSNLFHPTYHAATEVSCKVKKKGAPLEPLFKRIEGVQILKADTAEIISDIKSTASNKKMPDGTTYSCISSARTDRIARHYKVEGRDIEITALKQDIIPERYVRNMKTLSPSDQATLLASRVCVAGLGGLGGVLVEMLARVGVGAIDVIDGDRFEDSNLNRQFLSTASLLRKNKAKAAAQRIAEINPSVVVQEYDEHLNEDNADHLVKNADVVVDCLDNVTARFLLEKTARKIGSPLVSAAVAGLSGHITSIFPEDIGLRLIYGEPDHLPQKGAEASLGCLTQAVTLMAAVECSEVVKILLCKGSLLRNKLLVVDLMDNTMEVLSLI
jgi:molybdopterin/thiamine biosynthesis adenylyltransferase